MDRLGWGDTQSKDGWMGLTIYLTYDYAGRFRMYMTSFFLLLFCAFSIFICYVYTM